MFLLILMLWLLASLPLAILFGSFLSRISNDQQLQGFLHTFPIARVIPPQVRLGKNRLLSGKATVRMDIDVRQMD